MKFEFEDVWENSADGIRMTDSEGIIVGVNPAFCRMFDKPEEELVNQPFHILYHSNIQGEIYKEYRDDFFNREIKTYLERKAILWNGRKVWFGYSNSTIKNKSNETLVISIVRDISERKENELELTKS